MEQGKCEYKCSDCQAVLEPKPTPENKPLVSTSIYAQTKKDQEEMALIIGKTYDIPTVALRYFNVYGPRQSLNNPYTGVCAIFSSRIKNNNPPLIFEDGNQSRDFVHVEDIARVNQLVLEKEEANMKVFNVGTGVARTIKEIAELLINLYDKQGKLDYKVVEKFRKGDIRHCYSDISHLKKILNYEPKKALNRG